MRIAVVGAGITGRCIAWRLATHGHKVNLYEARPLDHTEGSSHGRSRIVRQAYPDPFWTRILDTGYPMWRELEAVAGHTLVNEVGLLYIGPEGHPEIESGVAGLEECRVPFERLDTPKLKARYPTLRWHEREEAIFTPAAGWVNADAARAAAWHAALLAGAQHVPRAYDGDPADCVIWAVGPWATDRFPHLPLTVTRQFAFYFAGLHDGPVWIEAAADHPYGFPHEPGSDTLKVALHAPGPPRDVIEPSAELIARTEEAAAHRLRELNPLPREWVPCLYTNAPDDRFFIYWDDGQNLVVSACSGHGFKFGPWLGWFVAQVIAGQIDLADWPAFRP